MQSRGLPPATLAAATGCVLGDVCHELGKVGWRRDGVGDGSGRPDRVEEAAPLAEGLELDEGVAAALAVEPGAHGCVLDIPA